MSPSDTSSSSVTYRKLGLKKILIQSVSRASLLFLIDGVPETLRPIVHHNAHQKEETLENFIADLRKYKRSSIVNFGMALLYLLFQKKPDVSELPLVQKLQIQNFGPKLIALALATTNESRTLKVGEFAEFHNICHRLMGIKTSISDDEFMHYEA